MEVHDHICDYVYGKLGALPTRGEGYHGVRGVIGEMVGLTLGSFDRVAAQGIAYMGGFTQADCTLHCATMLYGGYLYGSYDFAQRFPARLDIYASSFEFSFSWNILREASAREFSLSVVSKGDRVLVTSVVSGRISICASGEFSIPDGVAINK